MPRGAFAWGESVFTVLRMKRWFAGLVSFFSLVIAAGAAELSGIEQQVAEAVKSPRTTVVHFWAPWCSNCNAELARNGWSKFIAKNPEVDFIFITIWRGTGDDGRALLEKNGVGAQKNFQFLVHPNAARQKPDRVSQFLGLPVSWIPTTWVFKEGELRFALNYGELRFPVLQQLIRDSSDKW
jgi:thiol-disulfide isomerase/thioredoxin